MAEKKETTKKPDSGLCGALVSAQAEFTSVVKAASANITASREYNYATLDDTIDMLRPILAKHDLAFVQEVQAIDGGPMGECITTIIHKTGAGHTARTVCGGLAGSPQDFGKAITYAKRYGLSATFGISLEDDTDGDVQAYETEADYTSHEPLIYPEGDEGVIDYVGYGDEVIKTVETFKSRVEYMAFAAANKEGIEGLKEGQADVYEQVKARIKTIVTKLPQALPKGDK